MAQFDVHRNPKSRDFPLLLEVQAAVLSRLSTRVVVPMAKVSDWGVRPIARLNPTARVGGVEYLLVFQELAAIPADELGARVGSLAQRRAELVSALDLLFTGL
jgi:toxin CcdB